MRQALKFTAGNAKLDTSIITFSLPAGHTCPFASECQSRVDPKTGRIRDGRKTRFRCFSASQELWRVVRDARWWNYKRLKPLCHGDMVELILKSLSPFAETVRIHVSGDYFSQNYFDAWLSVAENRHETLFYGYTKSLKFWIARLSKIPANLVLTASYGGKDDHLIAVHGLRYAKVVFSLEEAAELGLKLDHDDSLAMKHGPSFGLLLHGIQPKGTEAAVALQSLKLIGETGYSRKAAKEGKQ